MLSSDRSVSEALEKLSQTDGEVAQLKALMKSKEHQRQTVKALSYLEAEQMAIEKGERWSVAKKEAVAMRSQKYRKWVEDFENSVADYETMNNERNTHILEIEVWRSEQANRRKGNI